MDQTPVYWLYICLQSCFILFPIHGIATKLKHAEAPSSSSVSMICLYLSSPFTSMVSHDASWYQWLSQAYKFLPLKHPSICLICMRYCRMLSWSDVQKWTGKPLNFLPRLIGKLSWTGWPPEHDQLCNSAFMICPSLCPNRTRQTFAMCNTIRGMPVVPWCLYNKACHVSSWFQFSFCASLTLCFFNTTSPLPDHAPRRFPWLLLFSLTLANPCRNNANHQSVLLFLKLGVQLFQSSPMMFLLFDIVLPKAVVSQEHSDCEILRTSKDDACPPCGCQRRENRDDSKYGV